MREAVDAAFETDFAIVGAAQKVSPPECGSFAGTAPGAVAALAGTKYARVEMRLELWDERPPFEAGWEDADELPFEAVRDAGPLVPHGFEPVGPGIDIADVGRARVQVLARGRQRYSYSTGGLDALEALPPEQWKLRFFQDDLGGDPLAGESRRLSGTAPFGPLPRSGTRDALAAWGRAGWDEFLWLSPGVGGLLTRLVGNDARARTAAEIAAETLGQLGRSTLHFQMPDGATDPLDALVQYNSWSPTDRVSEAAGRAPAGTIRDLLDALVDIGLLLPVRTRRGTVLVPNPEPDPVWEQVALDGVRLAAVRKSAVGHLADGVATDVINLLRWVGPEGLVTSPRRIAIRLALSSIAVAHALDSLSQTGQLQVVDQDLPAQAVDPALDLLYRIKTPAN